MCRARKARRQTEHGATRKTIQFISGTAAAVRVKPFPGHALHEKGLQRQLGVGTLVRNQERRAAVVPRINRLSTGYQPVVNRGFWSSIGLHRVSFVRSSRDTPRRVFFDRMGGTRDGGLLSEPTRGVPSCPSPPRPAVPSRPARDMSGFWIRQVRFTSRTTAAVRSWLLTSGPTLFCLCKPLRSISGKMLFGRCQTTAAEGTQSTSTRRKNAQMY